MLARDAPRDLRRAPPESSSFGGSFTASRARHTASATRRRARAPSYRGCARAAPEVSTDPASSVFGRAIAGEVLGEAVGAERRRLRRLRESRPTRATRARRSCAPRAAARRAPAEATKLRARAASSFCLPAPTQQHAPRLQPAERRHVERLLRLAVKSACLAWSSNPPPSARSTATQPRVFRRRSAARCTTRGRRARTSERPPEANSTERPMRMAGKASPLAGMANGGPRAVSCASCQAVLSHACLAWARSRLRS